VVGDRTRAKATEIGLVLGQVVGDVFQLQDDMWRDGAVAEAGTLGLEDALAATQLGDERLDVGDFLR
jgi:hypothetical protein